ncbi:membrane protein insertion efficiency factor YidD [Arcobacter sp. FWKO B]|uniref:membrane protein insertion efficiency factor YidD n=1 Tax=Arcobacter sp. FWKO B TaxID=2593672 RepID=UPI0018A3564C|nr:membrane protein insertion efficiency factor YidD [Arcobacter sp. FWKO B]QOG12808.1 membrane protein insertion efficiency factor YidD [Arcobacter sp. FWKO B]
MSKLFTYLIKFYQKYLSILSHGSCRYHPTCSEYSKWQFENNSFFKAIYHTITRILRCNQLFKGGFDYPTVWIDFKNKKILHKKLIIKYWLVPNKDGSFLVIKNWERNK